MKFFIGTYCKIHTSIRRDVNKYIIHTDYGSALYYCSHTIIVKDLVMNKIHCSFFLFTFL